MQTIQDLFSNRVLLSGLIGWGAAQVLKTIIYALMHHTLDLTRIFGDGGMPSGHSATVCAAPQPTRPLISTRLESSS